jgi:hypothetical protein
MNTKPYLTLSGVIFTLVALGHLLRAVNGWMFRVGDYDVPQAASWVAVIVAGSLAAQAFRLLRSG